MRLEDEVDPRRGDADEARRVIAKLGRCAWETKARKRLRFSEMSTRHLFYAARYLRKRCDDLEIEAMLADLPLAETEKIFRVIGLWRERADNMTAYREARLVLRMYERELDGDKGRDVGRDGGEEGGDQCRLFP